MEKRHVVKTAVGFLVASLVLLSYQNCGNQVAFNTSGNNSSGTIAGGGGPTVCDPFGGNSGAQINNGLIGTLHYLTSSQLSVKANGSAFPTGQFSNFSQVYNGALGIFNGSVILSSVNVPTRNFTQGFVASSGTPLQNSDGSVLQQYFAMEFQSELVLGNLAPGNYQLATISDDGSILTLSGAIANSNGTNSDYVLNADGTHSSLMTCSATPLNLTAQSQIPLDLKYFQGPPVSIAMMILYRPAPADGSLDPQCNQVGDQYFFNTSTTPSTPQQPYLDIQSRGWAPLPATNYVLPNQQTNPCTQ